MVLNITVFRSSSSFHTDCTFSPSKMSHLLNFTTLNAFVNIQSHSFAIVKREIATRKIPFEEYTTSWAVADAVIEGKRPLVPTNCGALVSSYFGLMQTCWSANAASRPTFRASVGELSAKQQ